MLLSMLSFTLVVVVGAMPLTGVMPSGRRLPEPVSGVWWPQPSPSAAPPWWRDGEDGGSDDPPLNKLAMVVPGAVVGALIPLSSCRHGGGRNRDGETQLAPLVLRLVGSQLPARFVSVPAQEEVLLPLSSLLDLQQEKGGGEDADGDSVHHQQWTWRGYSARAGLPVFSGDLLIPMAERQPFSFLPAMLPKGR